MSSALKRAALIFAVAGTIGCDRVTKHFAEAALAGGVGHSFLSGTIRLQYAENTGGFLGVGGDLHPTARTAVFSIGTAVVLLLMVGVAVRNRLTGWPRLGIALFVAGGLSNWVDRIARGSVVDFLNVGIGPVRTGIFNVADVAIMLGAAVFVLTEFAAGRATAPADPPDPS
jgi:signal peptidase II